MPKKYRLSRADFLRLSHGKSRRMHGTYFAVTMALLGGSIPKTACVVAKKIASRAVDRNRIQRHCREVTRPYMKDIHQPLALIFYGKRGVAKALFVDIKKDIERLLAHAQVLAHNS